MANIDHLYPPSPRRIPSKLLEPTREYTQQVVLVLVCLIAFFILYLGLTAGSAYVCVRCVAETVAPNTEPRLTVRQDARGRTVVTTSPRVREYSPVILIPGALFSGLLFLFLVKGLFRGSGGDPRIRVEVTEEDQPLLFAFIERLCDETGAPRPHRVFLLPDVDASVAFDETFLNLVFPSKKNLSIGLGLVNCLTLSEFKAVLAHEFGHVSQSSMRVSRYVATALHLMEGLVLGRDWFDRMIEAGCKKEWFVSIFALAFLGIMTAIRLPLKWLFIGFLFARTSLSRQMEYNADLVAVSVTGSDELIFALARLTFAEDSLRQAWEDLRHAADHGRFTRDVYYHQAEAGNYLRVRRGNPNLGVVPPLPADPTRTVWVFKREDTRVPTMWATHPSNYDREENAKERYIRGASDERPAWVLFRAADKVRRRLTRLAYKARAKGRVGDLEEPEEIQEFIDAEHAETMYPPQYHGLYEDRYIKPGTLDDLTSAVSRAEYSEPHRLAAAHAGLSGDDLRERMEAHRHRLEEANHLAAIVTGTVELSGEDFRYRGRRYEAPAARRLLKRVQRVIEADFEWMHKHDRTAFRVHYAMAHQLGDEARDELEERYAFHFALQGIHAALRGITKDIQKTVESLVHGDRELTPGRFRRIMRVFRDARKTFERHLRAADELNTPALANLPPGTRIGSYLFGDRLVRSLGHNATTLQAKWVNDLMNQMGEAMDRAARVLFKSLGAILALQDRIAADWHAGRAGNTPATEALPLTLDPPPRPATPPGIDKPRNRPGRVG